MEVMESPVLGPKTNLRAHFGVRSEEALRLRWKNNEVRDLHCGQQSSRANVGFAGTGCRAGLRSEYIVRDARVRVQFKKVIERNGSNEVGITANKFRGN
jgi:hypothetical protein